MHNPLATERTLATVLPDTGGLKPGFSVTMRGVPIGSVSGLKLVPNGVRVTMTLQPGNSVPNDVAARVQRANPLGEQQLVQVDQAWTKLIERFNAIPAMTYVMMQTNAVQVDGVVGRIDRLLGVENARPKLQTNLWDQ